MRPKVLTNRLRFLISRLLILESYSLLLAGIPIVSAAGRNPNESQATIEVSTLVVDVYVVVEDDKGRRVSDLTKDDFTIKEDNIPQITKYFARNTEAALTLGLVFDTSPSQENVLSAEREQAKRFIQDLLRTTDSAFILRFDDQISLLQDLTSNPGLLRLAIDKVAIGKVWTDPAPRQSNSLASKAKPAGTRLYDAVCAASDKLTKTASGRKVLLLLTDGQDQGSQTSMPASLDCAEKANAIIYSVAISDSLFYTVREIRFRGDAVLTKFSDATGGRMFTANSVAAFSSGISQIGEELRGQYLLGYTPEKQRNKSFHKIKVTVRDHKLRVRSRRGYYEKTE